MRVGQSCCNPHEADQAPVAIQAISFEMFGLLHPDALRLLKHLQGVLYHAILTNKAVEGFFVIRLSVYNYCSGGAPTV
jgi:hypothetical protein